MIVIPVIRRLMLAAATCLAMAALMGAPALADGRHHNDDDRKQRSDQGPRISLDEAVQRAERHFHARVVKAESRSSDGRTVYVLRLVSEDGRVFSVRVDAQTGSMD